MRRWGNALTERNQEHERKRKGMGALGLNACSWVPWVYLWGKDSPFSCGDAALLLACKVVWFFGGAAGGDWFV